MKTLYLLVVMNVALILSACASTTPAATSSSSQASQTSQDTQPAVSPPKCHHHPKEPTNVSFYIDKQKPNGPYEVLGEAKVSKYNTVGVKRQEATIRDLMSQMAASIGGDAVMDFKNSNDTITAKVIAYPAKLA